MSTKGKAAVAAVVVAVLAVGAFFLLGNKKGGGLGGIFTQEPATCPLTGEEPRSERLLDRPAVAVKIENAAVAYPLSGLEEADLVYEEVVEGGITRFMALYHCGDSVKAGPVRSARLIDPAIMIPATKILAFSGANATVFEALDEAGVVQIEENTSNGALSRVTREGLAFEHTLYADTKPLRKLGSRGWDEPPPEDMFEFGERPDGGKRTSAVNIQFASPTLVRYEWQDGRWLRSQNGAAFMTETGAQLSVDNVLIEEHEVNDSTLTDVAGNASVEIADQTGEGRAVLLRDGRRYNGRWIREDIEGAVRFETKKGEQFVFAPGTVWIHLVPSASGDVKGSFSFER